MNKPLHRFCPDCKNEIVYKSRVACRAGERKNSPCTSCRTIRQYKNDPTKNKGEKNGRFGLKLIDVFEKKHGKIKGHEKYNQWKFNLNKFKSGIENPQYGKESNLNSGISYCGWYKSIFFRSSYELFFIIEYEKENGILPISAENKNYKVLYEISGKTFTYLPDFYCPITSKIFEIKPKKYLSNSINKIKFETARLWFSSLNIEYKVICEKELKITNWQNMIYNFFYDLVSNNTIKLTKKSLLKFKKALLKKNMISKLQKI
jgi:hypothetical protein